MNSSSWACRSRRVRAGGWARSHFFRVCWKRSTLPWVWGWLGRPFFWSMPRMTSSRSKSLGPCRNRVVKTKPLSVNVDAGMPWASIAARNAATTMSPVTGAWAVQLERVAGVVVQERQDLHVGAVGQGPVGEVGLPALVRQVRLEPQVGALGSLARLRSDQPVRGSGSARSSSPTARAVPGAAGGRASVWGPASRPAAVSSCLRATIRATVSSPVAFGFDLGRVDFFSTASQPPARHRATSLPTQTVEIPYCRATDPCD